MSDTVRPERCSALTVAGMGAWSIGIGATAASTAVWTRATGVIPSSRARSEVMTSRAAAPSEICELFAAVMRPSGRNAGFSPARPSSVDPCGSPRRRARRPRVS
jgi:hypothetical protein